LSGSSGSDRLKIQPARTVVNVLKRDGSTQPFDQNKLVSSITKAGATQPQATLVANRVVNRINTPTVHTTQLSSMVARSLSRVNTTASSQYTAVRDQKLNSLSAATNVTTFAKLESALHIGRTFKSPSTSDAPPLVASAGPQTSSVEAGHTATFRVAAAGGIPPYRYEWLEGSTTIGTFSDLAISKDAVGTYSFCCRVTDSTGSIQDSNSVTMTVTPVRLALTLEALGEAVSHNIGINERVGVNVEGQRPVRNVRVGSYITLEARLSYPRTGIVTYFWDHYARVHNVGIHERIGAEYDSRPTAQDNRREVMENGINTMLVLLDKPGIYKFKVTWPGDEETSPITSNTISVTATEA
jgi:hypothetical protein